MNDVELVALCDWDDTKLAEISTYLEEKGKGKPYTTKDYKELLKDESKASMRAGKYTALEVGCVYDIQECHDLIQVYEETKTPLMMLENCCYGRREMMALNLVEQGLLGEVVHCKGGYMHYLNKQDMFYDPNAQYPHYRVKEYMLRNCENYPTHELGPICKVLKINRGNRMMKLTSTASKSRGLKTYAESHLPADSIYNQVEYKQGDIVNTCITCANGETILLTLDTTLPRPYYSRDFTVRGTKGMYTEERKVLYFEDMEEEVDNNEEESFAKYDHPLHAEYTKLGERGGHNGMDWLVCRAFVESVKNGTNTPIDAYDTITLMSIGALSEMSIQKGGAPVDIPDFTKGKWMRREPIVEGKYCLDKVCVDPNTEIY